MHIALIQSKKYQNLKEDECFNIFLDILFMYTYVFLHIFIYIISVPTTHRGFV
jgi:hypothetical protein